MSKVTLTIEDLVGRQGNGSFEFRLPGRRVPVLFTLSKSATPDERIADMTYQGMPLFHAKAYRNGMVDPDTGAKISLSELPLYVKSMAFEFLSNQPIDTPLGTQETLQAAINAMGGGWDVEAKVSPDEPALQEVIATGRDTKELVENGADVFGIINRNNGRRIFIVPSHTEDSTEKLEKLAAIVVSDQKTILGEFALTSGMADDTPVEVAEKMVEYLLGK